jgi:hypothetical protein
MVEQLRHASLVFIDCISLRMIGLEEVWSQAGRSHNMLQWRLQQLYWSVYRGRRKMINIDQLSGDELTLGTTLKWVIREMWLAEGANNGVDRLNCQTNHGLLVGILALGVTKLFDGPCLMSVTTEVYSFS